MSREQSRRMAEMATHSAAAMSSPEQSRRMAEMATHSAAVMSSPEQSRRMAEMATHSVAIMSHGERQQQRRPTTVGIMARELNRRWMGSTVPVVVCSRGKASLGPDWDGTNVLHH